LASARRQPLRLRGGREEEEEEKEKEEEEIKIRTEGAGLELQDSGSQLGKPASEQERGGRFELKTIFFLFFNGICIYLSSQWNKTLYCQ
jgi:hypothetical protein